MAEIFSEMATYHAESMYVPIWQTSAFPHFVNLEVYRPHESFKKTQIRLIDYKNGEVLDCDEVPESVCVDRNRDGLRKKIRDFANSLVESGVI